MSYFLTDDNAYTFIRNRYDSPGKTMYVSGTTPEFMEGSAPKHSLPPWAVTNGEWRGDSNSLSRSRL